MAEPSNKKRRTDARTGVYYGDYLQLDTLLGCVQPESFKEGTMAHDEHLFVVIHQVYELWFKQILHELDSVMKIFSTEVIEERNMLTVISRLKRITEIQKILIDQVKILETMDAMNFLEFRHLLVPASGFQSVQFRVLENKLGIQMEDRTQYQQKVYKGYFSEKDVKILEESEQCPSMLRLLEKWLERNPGLSQGSFSFFEEFKKSVEKMLEVTKDEIHQDKNSSEEEKKALTEAWTKNQSLFQTVLSEKEHNDLKADGARRLSHKAFIGALMIYMFRDEPKYHLPFQMITLLTDIDSNMIRWRHQHLQMVQRTIGSKIGTGGSSGYQYLRTTITDRYRIYLDLVAVPTFVLPRRFLPVLPQHVIDCLNFK